MGDLYSHHPLVRACLHGTLHGLFHLVWDCEVCTGRLWKARSLLEGFLEQDGPDQQRWLKGKNENKNATDAHDLDSTNTGPEAEIGGSDMSFFNVDAVENRV